MDCEAPRLFTVAVAVVINIDINVNINWIEAILKSFKIRGQNSSRRNFLKKESKDWFFITENVVETELTAAIFSGG